MSFKRIPTGRLADNVTSQIKSSIFDGEYKPGERIPSEYKLVEIFGVSRVIVREAIRNLEREGLIGIKRGPKGGAFVQSMKHDAVSQIVKDFFILGKGTVADITEVRLEMEPIVAGLAAERATKEDIQMLAEAIDALPLNLGDDYVAANINFHRILAMCSHNPIYVILINILSDFVEDLVLKVQPADRAFHDTTSHSELYGLIRKGDIQGTIQKMRSHIEDTVPQLKAAEKRLSKERAH